jgi:hypothetical protein
MVRYFPSRFTFLRSVLAMRPTGTAMAIGAASVALSLTPALAEEPASRTTAADTKLALKDLDGHFPFSVPESKEAWEARAAELRQQLLVSLGLYPMPKLAPVQPVVHSRREMNGYAIEKVYFESLPGLFVTGSLYTPTQPLKAGQRRPAVLCPHGHWANGRFYYTSDADAKRELATGAERFESAAHSPLQARCVQMARMGIVVFHYDMLGNADSQQIRAERVHGFGNHGPNPEVPSGQWLLYSPEAEGWLQNIMGMQTLNTLQSLEFLLQRDDVDADRISITGASGGGTQTFIASAIEPRFAGAYPLVMVSTSMQGGCTCENAVGLRIDTGNVEIAALTAPRPLGVNAANDWTRDMGKDGFPELKKLYALYNAADRVSFHSATHFLHNYNHVTRVPMYGFMNRLFGLGLEEPVLEEDFTVLRDADLTVWDAEHPQPPGGIAFEADLLGRWANDVAAQIEASPEIRFQGWKTLLSPANKIAASLSVLPATKEEKTMVTVIRNTEGNQVGLFKLLSNSFERLGNAAEATLVVRIVGMDSEIEPSPGEAILAIQDAWGIDTQGTNQSLVKNPRPAACYTYGYNPSLFQRRMAVALAWCDSSEAKTFEQIQWTGGGVYGAIADALVILRNQNPPRARTATQVDAFDFSHVSSIKDADFLPGALRFGGRAGLHAAAMELNHKDSTHSESK